MLLFPLSIAFCGIFYVLRSCLNVPFTRHHFVLKGAVVGSSDLLEQLKLAVMVLCYGILKGLHVMHEWLYVLKVAGRKQ